MKMACLTATVTAILLGGPLSPQASGQRVLLFDDFAAGGLGLGDGTSVNGGFQLVSNSPNGTGALGESGGNATIATNATSFDNTGIVSINGFDASNVSSLSATWTVDSQTPVNAGNFNRTELLLQGGTSNGTGDGSGFRATPNIIFELNSGGAWVLDVNDGSGTTILSSGMSVGSGADDGYTVTMDLDEDGWAISGTGFATNPADSGLWPTGFDFSNLQTTLFPAATIQNATGGSASLNVDSINVSTVPEPASLLLWIALAIGCIIGLGRQAGFFRKFSQYAPF